MPVTEMRFAFLLTNLAGGGAEKAVLKTALALHQKGHVVHLILLEAAVGYQAPVELPCHLLAQKASHGWLGKRWLARRLAVCVREIDPDLLVSTLPFADEIAVLANLPRHCCRIANTLSAEVARLQANSPAKAARRLARYRALYGRRHLIAVSAGVAEDLRKNLGLPAPIVTIPNPFDFAAIRRAASQPCQKKPAEHYVIHVGRFSAQKRHDLLLDAWQHVATEHKLLLLTQPEAKLLQMIEERGLRDRVVVAGFQQNPYPWMAGADLLVLCSDHEGLPNVLIEALICGTPVISTDCPSGPREILGEAFPDGLIPCADVSALAGRIAAFLSKPPDIAGIDLERYDVAQAVDAYERLALRVREPA